VDKIEFFGNFPRNVFCAFAVTSDRDIEKTLKVDKIEFFGNFPRNVFCAFAVTLFARPKKLDVDDHSCFASPSYGEQVIVGRTVVLIGFFGNPHRRFLIKSSCPCSTAHSQAKKLLRLVFTCAGCTHQQDIKRGRDCYTPGFLPAWLDHHRFLTRAQKGQTSSTVSSPSCKPAPRPPLMI